MHNARLLSHEVRHLLLLLVEIVLVIPTPSFDEIVNDELYAPSGLFVNFVDDGKNFLLLRPGDEAFARMMDRAKCYACDTSDTAVSERLCIVL